MKPIIMAFFCFFPLGILLADEKKDLSSYQTLDMKQFDKIETVKNNPGGVKFSVTCKTEEGKELNSTDPEYQSCLTQSQNKIKNQGK